jgi:hypothetical protein
MSDVQKLGRITFNSMLDTLHTLHLALERVEWAPGEQDDDSNNYH